MNKKEKTWILGESLQDRITFRKQYHRKVQENAVEKVFFPQNPHKRLGGIIIFCTSAWVCRKQVFSCLSAKQTAGR